MDIADRATELEQDNRDRAIAAVRNTKPEEARYNKKNERVCLDCLETIPSQRVELLDAKRCMTCQTALEQKRRRYGR